MNLRLLLPLSLALVFVVAGGVKLFLGRERLLERMPWAEDFSSTGVRTIGLLEVLAAAGLLLGSLTTGLMPLAPISSAVLAVLMLGAGIIHFRREEYANLGPVIALFAVSLAVLLAGWS